MDLKGKAQASVASSRIRVWYVEESVRTSYSGTVVQHDAALGLKVWFDGLRASEQEWINAEDEWEWMEEPPLPEGSTGLPRSAVRLRMNSQQEGEDAIFMRLRGWTGGPAALPAEVAIAFARSDESAAEAASAAATVWGTGRRPSRQAASGARQAAQAAAAPIADKPVAHPSRYGSKRKSPGEDSAARPERTTHPSRSGRRKTKAELAAAAADAYGATALNDDDGTGNSLA
jgi:hypothetical protein